MGNVEQDNANTPLISVEGFRKTFYVGLKRKPSVAARDISFEVGRGEIFGFLGPNGAGKTTTIKGLLDLIRPDGGALRILGHEAASQAWRSKVGYMPEHPNFYDYLTGLEMVTWFARLSGLSSSDAAREAEKMLERVGLGHAMKRRLRGYSKGMLQRAGLAQAMVGSPTLLILDEPMTGLDPIGRREIRELILGLKAEGKTIFYSTHILPDVEMTCDRVSIINHGATVRTGKLDDILDQTTRGIEVVLSAVPDALLADLRGKYEGSLKAHGGKVELTISARDEAWSVAQSALGQGAVLERFEPHRDTLEEIFMRSLGGERPSS